MTIEVLARWTEMDLRANENDEEDTLKRLLGSGEDEPRDMLAQPKFFYSFAPLVFELEDVARFNRALDPDYTVLRFHDGEGCVIKFPYKNFLELFIQKTGRAISSLVPQEWLVKDSKARNKSKKPPTDDDLLNNI